jgi:hypothetical protein
VRYSSESAVFVKFPSNFKDFLKQKKRAAAAHDNFSKYTNIKKIPRMKTFFNEVIGGFSLLLFPKNIKEIFWTFLLYPVRLYIWMSLFYSSKIKKLKYSDAWKRIESTK